MKPHSACRRCGAGVARAYRLIANTPRGGGAPRTTIQVALFVLCSACLRDMRGAYAPAVTG